MSMERVIAAANLAGAHDFILELPKDMTPSWAREQQPFRRASGSGCHRPRAGRNPKILIFDEATSSLDYRERADYPEQNRQIVEGRTALSLPIDSQPYDGNRILTVERGQSSRMEATTN